MLTYNRIILIAATIVLIAGGVWFGISRLNDSSNIALDLPDMSSITFPGETNTSSTKEATGEISASDWEVYTNTVHRFSLRYPTEYIANEVPGEEGITYTFGKKGDLDFGFQIYVAPFNESPGNMTAERIKNDIPGMVVDDPQAFHFGNTAQGVAFVSRDLYGGETREMWFATRAYVYQISAPRAFEPMLSKIIATWEFR